MRSHNTVAEVESIQWPNDAGGHGFQQLAQTSWTRLYSERERRLGADSPKPDGQVDPRVVAACWTLTAETQRCYPRHLHAR